MKTPDELMIEKMKEIIGQELRRISRKELEEIALFYLWLSSRLGVHTDIIMPARGLLHPGLAHALAQETLADLGLEGCNVEQLIAKINKLTSDITNHN